MKKKTVGMMTTVILVVGVLGIFIWPNPVIQNPNFACALTEGNPQGPYYIPGAPYKEKLGESLEGQKLIISVVIIPTVFFFIDYSLKFNFFLYSPFFIIHQRK